MRRAPDSHHRRRLLPGAGLACRRAVGAGARRRDARRHRHAGAGGHRPRLRRRAVPLRPQPSRDQRHDRVLRAADVRHPPRDRVLPRWLAYAKASGMRFRTRPPGVVEGAVGAGTLNLPVPCARARGAGDQALQVHADRAAHAHQDAARPALPRPREAGQCDREGARRAGQAASTRRDPDRRGQPARSPGGVAMGRTRDQHRAARGAEKRPRPRCTCASATTAASRSRRAAGRS